MTEWQIALRAIGAVVALYALVHLVWAAASDRYSGFGFVGSTKGRPGLWWYGRLVLLWSGCTQICIAAVAPLLDWMPYEWGTNIEGEFQSARERLGQAFGIVLGLACLGFLANSNDRREMAAKERARIEAEVKREAERQKREAS